MAIQPNPHALQATNPRYVGRNRARDEPGMKITAKQFGTS
jgi:hypothetical protein